MCSFCGFLCSGHERVRVRAYTHVSEQGREGVKGRVHEEPQYKHLMCLFPGLLGTMGSGRKRGCSFVRSLDAAFQSMLLRNKSADILIVLRANTFFDEH